MSRLTVVRGRSRRAFPAVFFFILVFLLSACSNSGDSGGGGGGGGGGTVDTTAPTAQLDQSGLPLGSGTVIVVRFSESIDTATLVTGGTLLSAGYYTAWSTTLNTNDTLTITPTGTWTTGSATLSIDASDTATPANAMTTLVKNYEVIDGTVYFVDSAAADDTGNGLTPATAKRNIHAAISAATSPARIAVNAGTYSVSSDAGSQTHVDMKEGVDVYGGYDAQFSTRDPDTNVSTIVDTGTMAGTVSDPNRAVEVGLNITTATHLDGFTINGSASADANAFTTAVWIHDNGGIDLQHCKINGATSGKYSYTLFISGTGVSSVVGNQVTGGSPSSVSYAIALQTTGVSTLMSNTATGGDAVNGASSSYGLFLGNPGAHVIQNNTFAGGNTFVGTGVFAASGTTAILDANTISGGSGETTSGLSISASAPVVRNNIINGNGTSSSTGVSIILATGATIYANRIYGGSGYGYGYGVEIFSGTASIYNNLILGSSASGTVAGILMADGTITLRNNTIHAGAGATNNYGMLYQGGSLSADNNIFMTANINNSYCFFEGNASADPAVLRNNDFINCSTALYVDYVDGTGCGANDVCITTATGINGMADITASGNVSADPLLTDIDGADNDINNMLTNDWTFSGASPGSVTAGGLNGIDDGGWGYTTDFTGAVRPSSGNPWSIGAYEP